jgi:hypothetical protein
MKKNAKKEYSGDEVKRYLGVLSEDFQHKVSAIGEQVSRVHNDVKEVKRVVDGHTEMIGKLMVNVEVIKGDILEIKTDLKQKVDRSEFVRLERRVLSLESLAYGGRQKK